MASFPLTEPVPFKFVSVNHVLIVKVPSFYSLVYQRRTVNVSAHIFNPYVAIGGGVFYPPDALFIHLLGNRFEL